MGGKTDSTESTTVPTAPSSTWSKTRGPFLRRSVPSGGSFPDRPLEPSCSFAPDESSTKRDTPRDMASTLLDSPSRCWAFLPLRDWPSWSILVVMGELKRRNRVGSSGQTLKTISSNGSSTNPQTTDEEK